MRHGRKEMGREVRLTPHSASMSNHGGEREDIGKGTDDGEQISSTRQKDFDCVSRFWIHHAAIFNFIFGWKMKWLVKASNVNAIPKAFVASQR